MPRLDRGIHAHACEVPYARPGTWAPRSSRGVTAEPLVNGENAAGGFGITPALCQDFYPAGDGCRAAGSGPRAAG